MNYLNTTNTKNTYVVKEQAIAKMNKAGISGLTDRELIFLSLIDKPNLFSVSSVDSVLNAFYQTLSVSDLMKKLSEIDGISKDKLIELLAMAEFIRRQQKDTKRQLTKPSDVYNVIRHHYSDEQEYFIVVGVNGALELKYSKVITIGLVNQSLAHPREIFADAITNRCTGIFIAHNHPSKHLVPSLEDKMITLRVKEAGEILGIDLLDHIIFSDDSYYSLKEHEQL